MGFFDQAARVVGGGSGQRSNYEMTTVGDKKLTELQASGAEYIVLSGIKRHAPCTSDELAKDPQIRLTVDQIRTVMENLYSKGWIREARLG